MTTTISPETNNGVVTSFVPLTTDFASVSGCSDSYVFLPTRFTAFDPIYGISVNQDLTCVPEQITQSYTLQQQGGNTLISLGPLTCPQDWTTISSMTVSQKTLAICCPIGYELESYVLGKTGQGACTSTIQPRVPVTWAYLNYTNSQWVTTTAPAASTLTVGALPIVGWNIEQADATTTSSIDTSTASSTPAITSSLPSSTGNPNLSEGLSTGAKAGIGVGITVAVLGLAGLVAAFYLRRRRKQRAVQLPLNDEKSQSYCKGELEASSPSGMQNHQKGLGRTKNELAAGLPKKNVEFRGSFPLVEIDHGSAVHEMQG